MTWVTPTSREFATDLQSSPRRRASHEAARSRLPQRDRVFGQPVRQRPSELRPRACSGPVEWSRIGVWGPLAIPAHRRVAISCALSAERCSGGRRVLLGYEARSGSVRVTSAWAPSSVPAGSCVSGSRWIAVTHETIVITKHGRPVARLMPLDEPRPIARSVTLLAPDDDVYLSTGESWDADA